jgi:hypothetical protein
MQIWVLNATKYPDFNSLADALVRGGADHAEVERTPTYG